MEKLSQTFTVGPRGKLSAKEPKKIINVFSVTYYPPEGVFSIRIFDVFFRFKNLKKRCYYAERNGLIEGGIKISHYNISVHKMKS